MTDQLQVLAAEQHHLLHLQWFTAGVVTANLVLGLVNARLTWRMLRCLRELRQVLDTAQNRAFWRGAPPPGT